MRNKREKDDQEEARDNQSNDEKPFKFRIENKGQKRKDILEIKSEDKNSKFQRKRESKAQWSYNLKKPSHNLEWDRSEAPPVGIYNPKLSSKIVGLTDFKRQAVNHVEFFERSLKAKDYSSSVKERKRRQSRIPELSKFHFDDGNDDVHDSSKRIELSHPVRQEQTKNRIKLKERVARLSSLNLKGFVDLERQNTVRFVESVSYDPEGKRFGLPPALVSR